MTTAFALLLSEVNGQSLEVGVSGGGAYMLNDSVRAIPFKNGGYSVGVIARYNFNTRWTVRFSYNYNNITYNRQSKYDSLGKPYNTLDTTHINDFSLVGEFNFLDYATGSKYYVFSPYLFGGFSGFTYNGEPEKEGKSTIKFNAALTFGIGLKYSISKNIGLGFEWGMRKTFTDSLDLDDKNGSFWYGSDWYNITALTLTYKLNIFKNRCKNRNF